ncbi:MAG: sugar phosphate isomerase/epimerase [Clostridia bacterium]|nr:sugar phosphate isomerase/epimerase [Clostridia bacterium]
MKYGIQLYSVRDNTPKDMEGTLRALSEMGYEMVEFAGFFGHSAETVKGWLDKYGLVASGTHTGVGEIRDHYAETVAYHKTIGCSEIIIPGADTSSAEKLAEFIDFLNEYAPKLAADGLRLSYHNHDGEFRVSPYGAVIHEELQKRTNLTFEIDTYWAYAAGKDPVAILEALADRIPVIHIKDGLSDRSGKPLGMGTAPVKEVWETAKRLGIPMVVESETLTPDGLTEAKICIDYLKSLEVM